MEDSKLQKLDREVSWQSGRVSVDADSRPMNAAQETPLAAAVIGSEIGDRIGRVVGSQAVGIGDAIAGTDMDGDCLNAATGPRSGGNRSGTFVHSTY
jgi:hypothetical protein